MNNKKGIWRVPNKPPASWSNTWSLPRLLTNASCKPDENITCTLNIAPLQPGDHTIPREPDLTPIHAQELDTSVCNKTSKNRKQKNQNLTICKVFSMFLLWSNLNMTANKEHLHSLSNLVLYLIDLKAGMFGKDAGTAYRAQEMSCEIVGHLLQRAFFQLLTYWAQRQKLDFVEDAINTLVFQNSHFQGQSLTEFLLNSRDFKIQQLTTKTREIIQLSFFVHPSKTALWKP